MNFAKTIFCLIPLPLLSYGLMAQPLTTDSTPSKVFRTVAESVTTLQVDAGSTKKQGSAVAFRSSYDEKKSVTGVWLATNAHVVVGLRNLKVIEAGRSWPATVEYQDTTSDIAILYAKGLSLPSIKPFGTNGLQVGSRVFAIGSPLGLDRSLSEGIVSALRKDNGIVLVQTTAAISPGSSGGALLDEQGRLLAITTFKLQRGESLNFAVDATRIIQVTAAIDAARIFQAVYERRAVRVGSEEEKDISYIESDALIKWMLETRRTDGTSTHQWFSDKFLESMRSKNQFWGGNPDFEAFQAEFLATRQRTSSSEATRPAINYTRLSCRMNWTKDGTYEYDLAVAFDQSKNTVNGMPARVTTEEIVFPTGKDGAFTVTINRFSLSARIEKEARPNILNGSCVKLEEPKF